jgi:hypothetical protein
MTTATTTGLPDDNGDDDQDTSEVLPGFSRVSSKEAADKVKQLVKDKFGDDWTAAFAHYAGTDNLLSRDNIIDLLADAGVANRLTRPLYASAVIGTLDADTDGKVSADELRTVLDQDHAV